MSYIEEQAKKKHDTCSREWSYRHYKKRSFFEINIYDIRYRLKQACTMYANNLQNSELTVLDIGCGDGYLLSQIKASYKLGIDLSSEMIEKAKNLHPGINFMQQDVRAFQHDIYFDTIFCLGVVQYNEDLYKFISAVNSLLTHNGTLIISFPNEKSIFRRASNRLFCKNTGQFAHNYKKFISICNALGLEVVDVKAHTFGFFSLPKFLWPLNMLMNLILEKALFSKNVRSHLGLSYVCKFEKKAVECV